MVHRHILLVTFPAQGHLNPSLQFAKRLTRLSVEVTFVTTVFAHRRMAKTAAGIPTGVKFVAFSNGNEDGFEPKNAENFMFELRTSGSQTLKQIILSSAEQGRPVTCLVYTPLLTWATEVARDLHVPSALLWIQPAAVFDIYYYYFNGYEDTIKTNSNNPSWSIKLPGLPILSPRDIPSFLLPSSLKKHDFMLPTFKEQILLIHPNTKILVNTFDALETEALNSINKLRLIGVGPLIPSAFLGGNDPSDTSFGGDLFQKSKDYIEWLDSKPVSSVVYISFGSILVLEKAQLDEIVNALLMIKRPFLWVIRKNEESHEEEGGEEEKIRCNEQLLQHGRIVPWCSQLEVLSHPSLGCFVTHCGWNSTLESLVSGVPVVAFPQWTDQGTNAKLIEDVWGTGVRVKKDSDEEGSVVESGEIERCIEMVMGGEEMRRNAKKWKELAKEAMKEGGSSDKNLKDFVGGCGDEESVTLFESYCGREI